MPPKYSKPQQSESDSFERVSIEQTPVADDAFQDSSIEDKDFSLSITMGKKTDKSELIRLKAEQEYKRLQAQFDESEDSKQDAYDYFVNKDKKVTESDDFSAVSSDHVPVANESRSAEDEFNDTENVPVQSPK